MIALDRRGVLAGLAGGLLPARPASAAPTLRAALDTAAAADPAAALALLSRYDATRLTEPERCDLITARAGLTIDAAIHRLYPGPRRGRSPYRVTATTGAWKSLTPDADRIDTETAALRTDARHGLLPPRDTLIQARTAIANAAAKAPAPIAAAMSHQIAALAELTPQAPTAPGLTHLPQGRRLYTLLIQRPLGPCPAPDAIERRLLAELRHLHARARTRFAEIGMATGTIADRYARLWRDPRWLYPDDDRGRAQAIDAMNQTLAQLDATLPATYGPVPAWCRNVAARPMSAEDIAAGRSGYRIVPTPTRTGAYIVDLRDLRRRPAWSLPGVVSHELLPGHMLQLGLEEVAPPHPLRLDYAAAFVEGWGIHAEEQAAADGCFADPRVDLGHLHWLIFRVARALVDLGIHWQGWSIGHARHLWAAWQGEPVYFASFDSELARIPLEPGSRVAECLAWLAIRDDIRRVPRHDLAARHHRLLARGRMRIEAPIYRG